MTMPSPNIRLFNTLTREKEVFTPIEPGKVGMYTCGPTVYDYAHIGNFRAFIFEDLLKRWLKYRGFKVLHVMNLTDIDDKTIKGSRTQGIPLKQYTDFYAKAFFEDAKTLNIEPADVYPRATEHIPEMVTLIKTLIAKGFAYNGDDGSIYFAISKFQDYGKLSKIQVHELKAGARVNVDEYAKEEAQDFALWKAWTPTTATFSGKPNLAKGRPGWHIECSAMSMKYLGETFDIHCGGVDNMFPHHENEIAQSEAATGKHFVHYWMHNEHLLVEGKKMAKRLGNFYTLRDLLKKELRPDGDSLPASLHALPAAIQLHLRRLRSSQKRHRTSQQRHAATPRRKRHKQQRKNRRNSSAKLKSASETPWTTTSTSAWHWLRSSTS